MVSLRTLAKSYWADRSGLSLTEGLIVLPVLLLVMAAGVEVSIVMYQWNQTVKALQVGTRIAVVSDPIADISLLETYPEDSQTGDPLPISSAASVSCRGNTCIEAELDRLYFGSDGTCGGQSSGLIGMCDVASFLPANNIRITYTRADLGYVGHPRGPVVTVTLEVEDLFFDFLLLDDILRFFQPLGTPEGIAMPPHRVAYTSEDLCSEASCS